MHDFEQTVRDYGGWLRYHAIRRIRRTDLDLEEVMQEAWLLIWINWDAVWRTDRPGGLMKKLLDQAITAMWRARYAIKRTGITVPIEDWDGGGVEASQEHALELKLVAERLDRIPKRQRDVLVDRVLGDSFSEIAERQGVSAQRIQQVEAQARKRLTAR